MTRKAVRCSAYAPSHNLHYIYIYVQKTCSFLASTVVQADPKWCHFHNPAKYAIIFHRFEFIFMLFELTQRIHWWLHQLHRSGKSSVVCEDVTPTHHCQSSAHHRTGTVGDLCATCHLHHLDDGVLPTFCGRSTSSHTRRSESAIRLVVHHNTERSI